MTLPLAPKQIEFIANADRKWNLAHGSVRSGKTVCSLYAFMMAVRECPDSQIWMIGHTSETIFENAIRLLMEPKGKNDPFAVFRPYITWQPGKRKLFYLDKVISTLGAKDEGAIGAIQGKTFSLCYCDEMTLYPQSIIEMINSRLSNAYSKGFASMNPSHPDHIVKKWIDMAEEGDSNYYSLHFTLDDNPFVTEDYKKMIKDTASGIFYKRMYLGLWCQAEGAIFDFFDHSIHVVPRPPTAAEYWIVGIDYGTTNPFAAVLVGVSTGRTTQTGKKLWVESEYYWDQKVKGRAKTNMEFVTDVSAWLEPYAVKSIYIDPSAAAFKLELQRKGLHCVDANNNVIDGIQMTTNEMIKGNLVILEECKNLLRELQGYVWDPNAAKKGYDEPLKKNDHACDALRYAIATHKVQTYRPPEQLDELAGNSGILRDRRHPGGYRGAL